MPSKIIEVKDVSLTFKVKGSTVKALDRVSLEIYENEFLAVIGPSGCGKTTLLKMIAGILPPTEGSIEINGKRLEGPQSNVGMVFQTPVLAPWRNVLQNVMLPAEILGKDVKEYRDKAMQLIKLVGLEGFEKRYPRELSGGMRQRVSICRAYIHDPALLLMDEPFGPVDAITRDEMDSELERIWLAKKKTVVFVTHNISEGVFLADRVVLMTKRPGKVALIEEIGLPRPRMDDMKTSATFGNHVTALQDALKRFSK